MAAPAGTAGVWVLRAGASELLCAPCLVQCLLWPSGLLERLEDAVNACKLTSSRIFFTVSPFWKKDLDNRKKGHSGKRKVWCSHTKCQEYAPGQEGSRSSESRAPYRCRTEPDTCNLLSPQHIWLVSPQGRKSSCSPRGTRFCGQMG